MTFEEAREIVGELIPDEDEERNGWDAESLTIYHAERVLASDETIFNPIPAKPSRTNNRLRW